MQLLPERVEKGGSVIVLDLNGGPVE